MAAITVEQREDILEEFQKLATETGVVGVPRLVALFKTRNDTEGLTQGTLTEIAREALQTKASKQILRFPRESTSGGAVYATHNMLRRGEGSGGYRIVRDSIRSYIDVQRLPRKRS